MRRLGGAFLSGAALLLASGCGEGGGGGGGGADGAGGGISGSEYFAHRGGPIDTFAIVAVTGAPNGWTNPLTADWPTSTLSLGGLYKGHHWDVWKRAILARNPALRIASFTSPSETQMLSADIVEYTDADGRACVRYNYEALEHYLSMHKWVLIQHAVPPRTLARIAARSRVGTRFGLWCNFEAASHVAAWTTVLQPMQTCLLPYYLRGTRANINGHRHVDVYGASADATIPAIENGSLAASAATKRWWYVDVRAPAAAGAVWTQTMAVDELYGDAISFLFWDNVLTRPYFGEAQFYSSGSAAQRQYANAPWNVPASPSGLPVSNPDPMTEAAYRAGWVRLLSMHRAFMELRYGYSASNLKKAAWGNSSYPPAADYTPGLLGVSFSEWFFGNTGISEPLPSLAAIRARIDQVAGEERALVIGQMSPDAAPQAAWLSSGGPGGAYGTWADIVARVRERSAAVYAQTTREWTFWEPGFLPPEGS